MISNFVTHYFENLNRILSISQATHMGGRQLDLNKGAEIALSLIAGVRSRGNKIMLVGNGGSAAIVSHIQNDFCKAAGMPAMVFNDVPLLTAFANDDGYQVAFEKMATMWAKKGDLLIAVSSSGKSQNILRVADTCLKKGCNVITLSGFAPENELRKMGTINFYVPSNSYGMVELAHSIIGHFFTDAMAEGVSPSNESSDWSGIPMNPFQVKTDSLEKPVVVVDNSPLSKVK
jgi:D-sedoheptulose 7-phosphate isomerase